MSNMEQGRDISFEDVLPTDKFAIQDMFLIRIHNLGKVYQRIMQPYYVAHGRDPRAIADFYALADEFYIFAQSNIEKHLLKKEIDELDGYFSSNTTMTPMACRRIYVLFMKFATKSKLTELSEKRYIGSFAYARRELGMKGKKMEL
jgi:hypothetical protein